MPGEGTSLELLRVALDHVEERVFLMEGDSPAFAYVNASAAASLGYTPEEMTAGMTVFDVDPSMTPEGWRQLTDAMRRQRHGTVASVHRTRDGRTFPIAVIGNIVEYGGRTYNMAIVRDVSAEKAADAALRASAVAYRSLVENLPDLVLRWDRDLTRVYVNQSFARALGRPASALVGGRFGTHHRDATHLAAVEAAIRRVFATGETEVLDAPVLSVDGPLDVHLRLVAEKDEDGVVQTVLGIGHDITRLKEIERDLRSLADNSPDLILRFDRTGRRLFANGAVAALDARAPGAADRLREALGGELAEVDGAIHETTIALALEGTTRHFEARLVPEPRGTVLAIVRDVTTQRQLEQQFLQAQKMEAVGRLAGGIAHDFNNMLAVIQLQASFLTREPEPERLRKGLREIGDAAQRAANLTRQLLTFSRRQVKNPIDLDIVECVTGMTHLLRRVLGEDVVFEARFAAVPTVHADPGMIEQVVMNLAINARDAMPDGGTLTLSLEAVDVGPGRAKPPGRYVCLGVSDTGSGIPPEVLPRIFEPFFTTKEVGKGTGLGLATVFAIVDQHDGFVEVESAVGRGATLRVLLPAVDAEPVARRGETTRAWPRGDETVLLVEDDEAVRASTRSALERLGYRVLTADSAESARALWREHDRVDLLVTDVVMPVTSGRQLAAELRSEAPALRVLFVSGYDPQAALDSGTGFLAKPFTVRELAFAVREALDARPP